MKKRVLLFAVLIVACEQPTTSALRNSGGAAGAMAADDGGASEPAAVAGTATAAASAGSAGEAAVPVDVYDDSGCEHPQVEADCVEGWCKIPSGCFIMGSPESEWEPPPQEKRVKVRLTQSFVIGETEVTQKQWTDAKLRNPSKIFDSGHDIGQGDCTALQCPVGNVTWFEAVSYANLLSEKAGLQACYQLSGCVNSIGAAAGGLVCVDFTITTKSIYDCEGYRLPTDPEWEYAARAGTRTAYYSGDITTRAESGVCVAEPALDTTAWYCMNSGLRTHPVGQLLPNAWGLFDVLGNAFEWAHDQSGWVPSTESLTDPDQTYGPGQSRDTRGGAHYGWPSLSRVGVRLGSSAGIATPGTGFRLVRTLHP